MSSEGMMPYEAILSALELHPGQMRRLKQLIVERFEASKDASELGKEIRLAASQIADAEHAAAVSVEHEIEDLIGRRNCEIVMEMIRLTPQLREIAHGVLPECNARGDALTGEQMLRLAELYREVYVAPPGIPPIDRSAGFDPETGLAETDRELVTGAEHILTAEQLDALQWRLRKLRPRSPDKGLLF